MKKINILIATALFLIQTTAFAYIGPGAGIPFIGSFIGFVVTVVLVISAILFWPIRKILKRNKANKDKTEENTKNNTKETSNK